LKYFTGNKDLYGNSTEYNDAWSLAMNYTFKNIIYNDIHGHPIIPVTGINPLSFPVIRNYTQNAHGFFFTRVITNFNMIPRMLDVKPVNLTQIGKEGSRKWINQRFYR
jgi:hypothetical protein